MLIKINKSNDMDISVKAIQQAKDETIELDSFDLQLGTLINESETIEVILDTIKEVRTGKYESDRNVTVNIQSDVMNIVLKCSTHFAAKLTESLRFNIMCHVDFINC